MDRGRDWQLGRTHASAWLLAEGAAAGCEQGDIRLQQVRHCRKSPTIDGMLLAAGFEDRPSSPRASTAAAAAAASASAIQQPAAPKTGGGYVPPARRAAGGAANPAAAEPDFSAAYERHERAGKASAAAAAGRPLAPGGAAPASTAASKNAAKRARKKAAGGQEGVAASGDGAEDVTKGEICVRAVASPWWRNGWLHPETDQCSSRHTEELSQSSRHGSGCLHPMQPKQQLDAPAGRACTCNWS